MGKRVFALTDRFTSACWQLMYANPLVVFWVTAAALLALRARRRRGSLFAGKAPWPPAPLEVVVPLADATQPEPRQVAVISPQSQVSSNDAPYAAVKRTRPATVSLDTSELNGRERQDQTDVSYDALTPSSAASVKRGDIPRMRSFTTTAADRKMMQIAPFSPVLAHWELIQVNLQLRCPALPGHARALTAPPRAAKCTCGCLHAVHLARQHVHR